MSECSMPPQGGIVASFDLSLLAQQWRAGGDLYSVRQDAHEGPQDGRDEGQDHSLRRGEEFRRRDTVS